MLVKLNTNFFFIAFFLIFFVSVSCDPLHVYEKNKDIPGREWNKNQAVTFDVPIDDSSDVYNMYINIRHTSQYKFRNIIFFIKTIGPEGTIAKDTVEYMLADKKGKWFGGGLGSLYFLQLPYKKHIRFPQKGVYRFEIIQGMREDKLPGINDIGIRIEKARLRKK